MPRRADNASPDPRAVSPVVFGAAKPVRASGAIVEQFREAIFDGRLKSGDRLPSTVELSRQFQISRNGVIEALRILERDGLVTVRRGSQGGAIVAEMDSRPLTDHFHLLLQMENVSIAEMLEMRSVIESQNAAWAAERAAQADLQPLTAIVDSYDAVILEDGAGGPTTAMLDIDEQFHVAVAEATGNRASVAFVRAMLASLRRMVVDTPGAFTDAPVVGVRPVLEAIADGNAEQARMAMLEHIGNFTRDAAGADPLTTRADGTG